MTGFTVYPAIDVREGHVVRLLRGDYGRQTTYDRDPVELAGEYAEAGASWLHLVDLDAALHGGWGLADDVRRIVDATGLRVQTGGGVRTGDDVAAILDAGAERVVVGSAAVARPEEVAGWLGRFGPEHLTVALDTRCRGERWEVVTTGWTEDSGVGLDDLLGVLRDEGLRHVLCTDVERDGTLTGSNLELYRGLVGLAPGVAVQSSGGVAGVDDVIGAREAGCAGAIVGKALLDGRVSVADVLDEERP